MKFLAILVALLSTTWANGQTFPNCDLQSGGESIGPIHTIYIEDNVSGKVLDLVTKDVVDATLRKTEASKYFEIEFLPSQDKLTLSVSSDYKNLEINEPSGPVTRLTLEIDLQCGTTSRLYLDVVVHDNNNQPTVLTPATITYTLPVPLPAKVPLYLFTSTPTNNKLTASDADISNNIITFELKPNDLFEISGELDERDPLGKTFVATIKSKTFITKPSEQTLTITAKDKDGKEPATRTVTIKFDEAASLPASLIFGKKYYEATYSVSGSGVHALTVESLVLVNPVATETIVTVLDQGGIGNFFGVSYDATNKAIVIRKHTDLSPVILDLNDFLTLCVQVSYENLPHVQATTVCVIVTLPSRCQAFDWNNE